MLYSCEKLLLCITAAIAFGSISCSAAKPSTLTLETGTGKTELTALNSVAVTAKIDEKSKSSYAYFTFGENREVTGDSLPIALEITVKTAEKPAENFMFGFLNESDFAAKNKLKNELTTRPLTSGSVPANHTLSISFALPGSSNGFFVHSTAPLEITAARLVKPIYGWRRGANGEWFGFSAAGGNLSEESATSFTHDMAKSFGNSDAHIRIIFEALPYMPEKKLPKIMLTAGEKKLEILQAPNRTSAVINTRFFDETDFKTTITEGNEAVLSITLESAEQGAAGTPIPADPGLILNWNRQNWRNPDFEVFCWQQFPSVLFFDTADYRVQDDFFKRLAFFVEKSGYKGRLADDSEIADKHGFNAHDYKASDLARFFETARGKNFSLNEKETLLRGILIENGIIRLNETGAYTEGEGGVISISRESPGYLRSTFTVHEGLHGLYFIDQEFRNAVSAVYNAMDARSLRFLLRYFSVTSSLNYDLNDAYLIQNEFMGYVMQQGVSRVADYFTKSIATRPGIVQAEPALVEHILQTNAAAFTAAAAQIDQYIFNRWGYNAGRVWLVSER